MGEVRWEKAKEVEDGEKGGFAPPNAEGSLGFTEGPSGQRRRRRGEGKRKKGKKKKGVTGERLEREKW